MDYIFTEKIIRPGLKVQSMQPKVVLVADPEPALCDIYLRHFSNEAYMGSRCTEKAQLLPTLKELEPHLLLLTLTPYLPGVVQAVRQITHRHPSLSIITLSDSPMGQEMSGLMELGIIGHINKSLTRPKDVVTLVRHVLEYK